MQVVILCGGQGTRIRDVADDVPKPMIPIGSRPILWHIMRGFAAHGLTDFILCLGYKSWVIKQYFLDYHLAEADLTLDLAVPGQVRTHGPAALDRWRVTLAETGPDAMTGCRVKRVEKYVTGDTFLLTYGDGVADVDLGRLLAFHRSHGKLGTVTAVRPPGRFGEIELDGTSVADFSEKPVMSRGRISGGFFVFNRALFNLLTDDESLMFEKEPLRNLAQEGELEAYLHDGFWHPMDNSRDYRYLNELWARGDAPWATWLRPGRRRRDPAPDARLTARTS
jgi:glucose-1-phosphate cytidylyltransferase